MELRLQDAERAIEKRDAGSAARIKGNIATVRAGAARKQHNSEAAISHLQEALANLPQDDVLIRSSAHFNLGSTYLDMGDIVKAERALRVAVRGAEVADNAYTLIAGKSYLADCYMLRGELRRAARLYEEAIDTALRGTRASRCHWLATPMAAWDKFSTSETTWPKPKITSSVPSN